MATDSTLRTYRPRRRGLEALFIIGFLVCLLLGAVALGALWLMTRDPEPVTVNAPMTLLAPEEVLIALATRDLAGDSTSALISQAMQANTLDTAAALLLFDTESTASGKAALWQQLARRWQNAGDADSMRKAQVANAQALGMGVLDLALAPLERSQLLTQAAAGLAAAGNPAAAIEAATQAKRVIAQSPPLLPAQRSQLLQPLKTVVSQLDAPQLLAEIDDLLRNPYLTPAGVLLTSSWSSLYTQPPEDPAVRAARETRELAARNLAERYVLTGGIDTEPEVQALRAALLAEDEIRGVWFRSALDSATSQQQQLGLLQEQQRWLVRKLAVAHRAYGILIAPEWENTLGALEGELNGLIANTETLVHTIAEAQPAALEQNLLRAEAAMHTALHSSLGLYPGADNQAISEKIAVAQETLAALGAPVALPVHYEAGAALPGFRIQAR